MNSLAELLADCDARGIRLASAGDGGVMIDAPQAALTSDMLMRLKAHKAELLAHLRLLRGPALATAPSAAVGIDGQVTFVEWDACVPAESIEPCPQCGSLELWWPIVGTPRCLHCDPPHRSRRLALRAESIRWRSGR